MDDLVHSTLHGAALTPWDRSAIDSIIRISDILIMRISESPETTRVGRRGTVVIPARLRRKYALEEGSLLIIQERPEGLVLRPAAAYPLDMYPPARVAEFLLNNAADAGDYARAVEEVRRLGIDPDDVPHRKPRSQGRRRGSTQAVEKI
jgi:AbrB family looped-hinge helix DNA binding protein